MSFFFLPFQHICTGCVFKRVTASRAIKTAAFLSFSTHLNWVYSSYSIWFKFQKKTYSFLEPRRQTILTCVYTYAKCAHILIVNRDQLKGTGSSLWLMSSLLTETIKTLAFQYDTGCSVTSVSLRGQSGVGSGQESPIFLSEWKNISETFLFGLMS